MKQRQLVKKISEAADLISNSSVRGSVNNVISGRVVIDLIEAEEKRKKRNEKIEQILND
jgi:hypothetical protein